MQQESELPRCTRFEWKGYLLQIKMPDTTAKTAPNTYNSLLPMPPVEGSVEPALFTTVNCAVAVSASIVIAVPSCSAYIISGRAAVQENQQQKPCRRSGSTYRRKAQHRHRLPRRCTKISMRPIQTETTAQPAPPPDLVIGNAVYCGILELPVMRDWSYPTLKQSPCRYSGSAETKDLIIAAHNYTTHFGRIGALTAGDKIRFTDTAGKQYEYNVCSTETLAGTDIAGMFSGQGETWDLTLYTCTIGGQNRITVRAKAAETDETE